MSDATSSPPNPVEDASPVVRWMVFLLGLWIMTVGIAVSVHAGLGTSPISTVPAALVRIVPLSFGTLTVIMNVLYVVAQIVLLRSRFTPINYSQFVIAFVFGALCDLSLQMTAFLEPTTYLQQWVLVVIGAALVGLGVFIEVLPRLVYVPGEGIVAAIATIGGWNFGTVKQCFDWALVVVAVIISLVFIGQLSGVREGTVFAAFAVGGFVKVYQRMWDAILRRIRR